ncbi:hypothetical protein PDJAM_G00075160, partial [Pangasius djambal]|nr:hypothetical protein [Pangasius djambal]
MGRVDYRVSSKNGKVVQFGRLRTFLFHWIMKEGQDHRFSNVRNRPGMFFVYWTLQGPHLCAVILLYTAVLWILQCLQ